MITTRTAIRDALSHTVGQLGPQGSPRNKGRSFLKLGVPTPFDKDTIRKLLVGRKQEAQHTGDGIPALHTS